MDIVIKAAIWYAVTVVLAALVISLIGPGLREVNGQLAFIFCLVAGIPSSIKLARENK